MFPPSGFSESELIDLDVLPPNLEAHTVEYGYDEDSDLEDLADDSEEATSSPTSVSVRPRLCVFLRGSGSVFQVDVR